MLARPRAGLEAPGQARSGSATGLRLWPAQGEATVLARGLGSKGSGDSVKSLLNVTQTWQEWR